MASWLARLSAAFVVAGTATGAYVVLQNPNAGGKYRPELDRFASQAKATWSAVVDTASATAQKAAQSPIVAEARLPFIVMEPRDMAAPIIGGPPKLNVQVAPEQLSPQMRLAEVQSGLPVDLEPVEARLRAKVPNEVFPYFDLYLYVSKATPDKGPWGQRMFVMAKQPDQTFKLLHTWLVSTGKEEQMVSPSGRKLGTNTPEGMFKLDRGRFHADYTSRQWRSPMPHAMFFDWQIDGRTSGLAIHGSDDNGAKELGNRASHGCIRLSADNARTLFELIQANYKGRVPVFSVDQRTGTMSTKGKLVRDEQGRVVMRRGYKVLVFIEDFGGSQVDTVAAIY
jgi:lipoprotein-anchoring transpeptidase ErfK/SrfK